jgi:hypothetical protein
MPEIKSAHGADAAGVEALEDRRIADDATGVCVQAEHAHAVLLVGADGEVTVYRRRP